MNINHIIKHPLLTEKSYQQMGQNIYTFVVDRKATKIEVKKAVEFIFDVKVDKINIINVSKKKKRVGRYSGFKQGYKKAIVTLAEGSINILPEEGMATDENLKAQEKQIDKIKELSEAEQKASKKLAKKKEEKSDKEESKEE